MAETQESQIDHIKRLIQGEHSLLTQLMRLYQDNRRVISTLEKEIAEKGPSQESHNAEVQSCYQQLSKRYPEERIILNAIFNVRELQHDGITNLEKLSRGNATSYQGYVRQVEKIRQQVKEFGGVLGGLIDDFDMEVGSTENVRAYVERMGYALEHEVFKS